MDWKHKSHQQIMRPWEPGSTTDYDQKKWNSQTKSGFTPQKEDSKASTRQLSLFPPSNSYGSFSFINNSTVSISVCFLVPFFSFEGSRFVTESHFNIPHTHTAFRISRNVCEKCFFHFKLLDLEKWKTYSALQDTCWNNHVSASLGVKSNSYGWIQLN